MVPLTDLWLPILVSAAIVTVAAAILARVMPVATVAHRDGRTTPFATSLGTHFVYALVISVMVAYLASRTLDPAADYKAVYRVAGTAAILAYAFGTLYGGVWGARPWPVAWKEFAHGVVYGALTAGPFGWLWPEA